MGSNRNKLEGAGTENNQSFICGSFEIFWRDTTTSVGAHS